ncbi:MAG: MBL fold metallo-hydrolase [Clostridia bacterium]|nr:MBL fold metallo-hydrolase [Clostridia bacterium]
METKYIDLGLGGGRLIQVANRTLTQMMSYVIDTPEGGVIVIDGGTYTQEDSAALYELLAARGKRVDWWFVTHAHSDHLGAMLYLMERDRFDIEIENLCFNFPSLEWLAFKEEFGMNWRFLEQVKKRNIHTVTPDAGDIYTCGSVTVEMIGVPGDYASYAKTMNATSIIFKVHFPQRDVLFMGDFDVHAEADFLARYGAAKLRCDILQMPHHGQGGISRDFYALIMPKICLYTAPQWLWENNKYRCTDPATVGKGPFTTLDTRRWMEELGVRASYTLADGDCVFE